MSTSLGVALLLAGGLLAAGVGVALEWWFYTKLYRRCLETAFAGAQALLALARFQWRLHLGVAGGLALALTLWVLLVPLKSQEEADTELLQSAAALPEGPVGMPDVVLPTPPPERASIPGDYLFPPETLLDQVKDQYEPLLAGAFVLERCGRLQPADKAELYKAFDDALTRARAGKGVRASVIQAAEGSYRELYSEISCENSELSEWESRLLTYLATFTIGAGDAEPDAAN